MTTPAPHTHHVFVDFENVPSVDLHLIDAQPVLVTLLIGRTQSKVDTGLLEQVHTHAAKVRLIRLETSGRNALDLTLAYYLGRAVVEHDGVELHIVSKDKDFDPLIAHLRAKNITVTRSESFATLPFLTPVRPATRRATAPKRPAPAARTAPPSAPPAPPSAPPDRFAKVVARLSNPQNRNRPATERALRAHLRTAFGKDASDDRVDEALHQLVADDVLSIEPQGRITYRQ